MKRRILRLLLLLVTLATISAVLYGAVNFGVSFRGDPEQFMFYWFACFFGVFLIIALAIIDMRLIRLEHRKNQHDLDDELAKIMSDAEEMAAEKRQQAES